MNYRAPRPQDESFIGKPITYSRGPNAGKTIRAELEEYQKPDLGRKHAPTVTLSDISILTAVSGSPSGTADRWTPRPSSG